MLGLLRRRWRLIVVVAVTALLLFYFFLSFLIGHHVKTVVREARSEFSGDAVTVLLAVVDSPDRPLNDRNRAVWALGQLGDARASATLEAFYTAEPCDHDKALCQHELEKAVDLCRGARNIGAWIWRHGELAER